LETAYDASPPHNIKIVLGDLIAQIGKEECYSPGIRKNSLHEVTNDNGDRLIQFALSHSMIVGSTIFKHKNIHKATWSTPDRLSWNQIDYVLIDTRHLLNLLDVRMYRGAHVDSDQYSVSKIKNVNI
jgi:hypothetical protein